MKGLSSFHSHTIYDLILKWDKYKVLEECCMYPMPISNQVFVFPILNLFAESRIPGKLKLGDWGHIVSVSGPGCGGWAGSWDTALAIVAWAGRHWPEHCTQHSGTNTDTGATLHTEPWAAERSRAVQPTSAQREADSGQGGMADVRGPVVMSVWFMMSVCSAQAGKCPSECLI